MKIEYDSPALQNQALFNFLFIYYGLNNTYHVLILFHNQTVH